MVQLMGSLHSDEVEDFTEEAYASLSKRSRFSSSSANQCSFRGNDFPAQPSQLNILAEPSPLGLKLRKTPSFLELIQMKLSQGNVPSVSSAPNGIALSECEDHVGAVTSTTASDKMKASHFPALLLRIGTWEYVSSYDGDLIAKCYFAKQKIVWEVLLGGLKSKMEIHWSDITAMKADCPDNGPESLIIVVARRPAFFHETNPLPRKHTMWQACTDFTDGQASSNRQHFLQCSPGVLNKHYEKLIQCDIRLSLLSRQPKIVIDTPFFKSQDSVNGNSEEFRSNGLNQITAMASPTSVFDATAASQANKNLSPAPDLVNHVGHSISEKMTCGDLPMTKTLQCQDIMDNIAQSMLNDTRNTTDLDEKTLVKEVNSLCSFPEDPFAASNAQFDGGNNHNGINHDKNVSIDVPVQDCIIQGSEANLKDNLGFNQTPSLPRNDSLADFLLRLPRIASLPYFSDLLFDQAEDYIYPAP